MAAMGLRLAGRANGVSALHGEVSRRDVRRPLARPARSTRCRSPRSPTACTPAPGPRPEMADALRRGRSATTGPRPPPEAWRALDDGHRRRAVGALRRTRRERLVTLRPAHGSARPQLRPGHDRRRRSRGPTSVLDPDVLTIGFARRFATYKRATLLFRDRRAAARRCCSTPTGRCSSSSPARPTRPTSPARTSSSRSPSSPPTSTSATGSCSSRTTTSPSPGCSCRACDVWLNTPLRPHRGVRHDGHEGRVQRRAQLLDPRRLVGRDVRPRGRLGHPVGRDRRRHRAAQRPRGRRASTASSSARSCRSSTTATPTACPPSGCAKVKRVARAARPAGRVAPACCASTSSDLYEPAAAARRAHDAPTTSSPPARSCAGPATSTGSWPSVSVAATSVEEQPATPGDFAARRPGAARRPRPRRRRGPGHLRRGRPRQRPAGAHHRGHGARRRRRPPRLAALPPRHRGRPRRATSAPPCASCPATTTSTATCSSATSPGRPTPAASPDPPLGPPRPPARATLRADLGDAEVLVGLDATGATRGGPGSRRRPPRCWRRGRGRPSAGASARRQGSRPIARARASGSACGKTSFSSSARSSTTSAPALGLTQTQSTPARHGPGAVGLDGDLEAGGVQRVDELVVELQQSARRRCRRRSRGAGRRARTTRTWAASASAPRNVPPPGPSVPTKSVSQNRHTAVARCSSRPVQRLQPVKRQNTAGRPAWAPSPCRVRKTSFTR